ncbi:MAG: ATP phosphoribosyltransferase regulatory subunit [Eubacteriales bacterium]
MNNYNIDGFQDIPFEELRGYDTIIDTVEKMMRSYGYKQVLTPSFESYDMYSIDGALPRDKMFKLVDHTGKVLVLRPDATIPISRMAAMNFKDEKEILKFGYITTIFRHLSSKTSFRKEFMQAGVEYLGNGMPDCDAEIIALAISILQSLGFKNIHIDIGQVSFLNAIFDDVQLEQKDIYKIYNLIENKNMGELAVCLKSIDLSSDVKKVIQAIPMLFGKFEETICKAKKICINERMYAAVNSMEETYEILKAYHFGDLIYVDLGFTNQLNYYSGLIFKGYVNDFGEAVLSGGRYDHLSSTFGLPRPASGFGINISLLMDILNESFDFDHYFDVLLLYDANHIKQCIPFATSLRKENIFTDCIHINNVHNINLNNYRIILKIKEEQLFQLINNHEVPITVEELVLFFKEEIK